MHLVKKVTFNALVTLVVDKEDCFQRLFKIIEAVRISKFVWQRVPDCRASIIKSPAAVRAKSAARHCETVQVSRTQTTTARSNIRGWDEVICEVPGCTLKTRLNTSFCRRLHAKSQSTQTTTSICSTVSRHSLVICYHFVLTSNWFQIKTSLNHSFRFVSTFRLIAYLQLHLSILVLTHNTFLVPPQTVGTEPSGQSWLSDIIPISCTNRFLFHFSVNYLF